ncbi:hypothetical protein GYMLUDRAFT_586365, partial [Collybiopsis luxurians FD-317 M1]
MQLGLVAVKQGYETGAMVKEDHRKGIFDDLVKERSTLEPKSRDRNECYPGTRLKVLTEIEDWINSDDDLQPVFCLSGDSGLGKTAIAVSVSQQTIRYGKNVRFAAFFCSSLSEEASNPNNIFPTLAAQFAVWEDVYPVFKDELGLHKMHDSEKKRHKNLLTRLLKEADQSQKKLLVIDGLDECKSEAEVHTILKSLLEIIKEDIPSLKILITCRSNSQISTTLFDYNAYQYSLNAIDPSAHARDLRILLSVELRARDITQ